MSNNLSPETWPLYLNLIYLTTLSQVRKLHRTLALRSGGK